LLSATIRWVVRYVDSRASSLKPPSARLGPALLPPLWRQAACCRLASCFAVTIVPVEIKKISFFTRNIGAHSGMFYCWSPLIEQGQLEVAGMGPSAI